MQVAVDPDRCRGHARCLMAAPTAFDFDDVDGKSFVVVDVALTGVLMGQALEAARQCPERAITVSDAACT